MRFTKMEGLGNDYVYVDLFTEALPDIEVGELARKVSDRHFGVGSDGLVLIRPSGDHDCQMRMYNSDGSEAQMCGNAVRCIAKLMYDSGRHQDGVVRIDTRAGTIVANVHNVDECRADVDVDMGRPVLSPRDVPVDLDGDIVIGAPIAVAGEEILFTAVSMGNPHCVIFVDEITDRMINEMGPLIESHPLFPERTNVEFVKVVDRDNIEMRVWERGAGETLACGTGASASVVASVLNGLCDSDVNVRLLGGDLNISWKEGETVRMRGPARIVFTGEYYI